jgi:tRNA A37 threonylcarbamoyltransferase TsaD
MSPEERVAKAEHLLASAPAGEGVQYAHLRHVAAQTALHQAEVAYLADIRDRLADLGQTVADIDAVLATPRPGLLARLRERWNQQ